MIRPLTSAAALLLAAASLHAQTVEFRIVERSGQTAVSSTPGSTQSTDGIFNFAVQARVVGAGPGVGLTAFRFTLRAHCEYDTFGTLALIRTSNLDGTYSPNPSNTTNTSAGAVGLAAQFTALSATDPLRNGLLNVSAGTFTNGPFQEIGLIEGSCAGAALLLQSDLNHDGNPDTWPGTGTSAPIDPAYATQYLGAESTYVDIYRFRYTPTNTTARRFFQFAFDDATAQIATAFQLTSGVWQPTQTSAPVQTFLANQPYFVGVSLTGGIGPGPGTCCFPSGVCIAISECACETGVFSDSLACTPSNPCQYAICCSPNGTCTYTTDLALGCAGGGTWIIHGTCTPNTCPAPGACCSATTGACTFVLQSVCSGTWSAIGTCQPSTCPTTGACCSGAICTLLLPAACTTSGSVYHGLGSTCGTPNNLTTCCPINFNAIDGVTTQDIFDFLTVWFALAPTADFDRSGVIEVFDVFVYIHDWFEGCH